ncbi:MAG: CHAT domain-containing protein [Paludibacteraceae bacterium]|nr:CHAT domain-containing protein [Paludibacteraceae bacterium]
MKRNILLVVFVIFSCQLFANGYDENLRQAILDGKEDVALAYLHLGADINALDESGLALMHRVAQTRNENIILWILQHGADIDVRDFEGSTPLMYAVVYGNYRIAYLLLKYGADKNIINEHNQDAIILAKQTGFLRMERLIKNINSYSDEPTTTELFFLGQEAEQKGEWDKAIQYAKQEQKQAKKEWMPNSGYYTRGLSDEGMIYIKLERYDEAEKALLKAMNHVRKYNPYSDVYYYKYTTIAFLYKEMGRYADALKIYNECIADTNKINDAQVKWQLYDNRASIYTIMGEYELAEVDFNNAIKCLQYLPDYIKKQTYCISWCNIAVFYLHQNTPMSIKKFAKIAMEILPFMEENDLYDQTYIRLKQNLCLYYKDFGYLEQAAIETEELKERTLLLLGEEHDDYIVALNLASKIALEQDKYDVAYENITQAMDLIIKRKTQSLGIESTIVSTWEDLTTLLLEDTSALWALEYAYNLTRNIYGEKSLSFITQNNKLGVFHLDYGKKEDALKYIENAYTLSKELYGDDNLNTLINGFNIFNYYAGIPSKRDSAYIYLKETDASIRDYLQNVFGVLTEQQREAFWEQHFSAYYSTTIPSFLIDYATHIDSNAWGDLYDNVLLKRGLILNSNNSINRIIEQSSDTILKKKWEQIVSLKMKLNSSTEFTPEVKSQLEQQKEQLEQEMMLLSDEFSIVQDNFIVHWQDIQKALKEDELAIEFIVTDVNHWGQFDEINDSIMYCALLLAKDYEHPIMVPLFEATEMHQFNFGKSLISIYDYNKFKNKGYNLIWEKLEPYLNLHRIIYFAPTHMLSQLALEALPITEDSVFGDYYDLRRVTSTREILQRGNKKNNSGNAVLYGGVVYDVSTDEMEQESMRYVNIDRSTEHLSMTRGSVSYLPGTKKEVEKIKQYLIEQDCNVDLYIGVQANEESFVNISNKNYDIIHLATHGFFWYNEEAVQQDIFKQKNNDYIDPLSRCGLLFAGANLSLSGQANQLGDGVADGVLTAREISTMDLSNCNLVVLSACETGQGEYSQDGTIGLQRAFKQAGVQTIIMSLWPVNDSATQMLMTEFYNNWIVKKQPKREAFKNAQNAVREEYEEPVYWAGFVMLD